MSTHMNRIGIIGGSGMLGRAISSALLDQQVVGANNFWISNRSGRREAHTRFDGVTFTDRNASLVDACDVILLCVPPANLPDIQIDARDCLVISVMAGVTLDQIREVTGASRVIRAMSSPAAELGLAFSPWVATAEVMPVDRTCVESLFAACGSTAEVTTEEHVEHFTAMTGPVPGFVAYFAECMVNYATSQGIPGHVADAAVRQLFLAAGRMMAESAATPAEHVQQMIDYAGTTAAGLTMMKESSIEKDVADGLAAAVDKTRQMSLLD